jgi:signal transduction histidine kinase
VATATVLDRGTLSFTIESRILRELGERLVKQPEVALLELIKNAYDADATKCTISYTAKKSLAVSDDGSGMTLDRFESAWMRIGTSSKEEISFSEGYRRLITGEKGIGRFAVRFLGRVLHLESVADDPKRHVRTRLVADFDWPKFDQHEDLGKVKVPYRLEAAGDGVPTGTLLSISNLRSEVERLDFQKVRTGSLGVLSPLRSLFPNTAESGAPSKKSGSKDDPGFQLVIQQDDAQREDDVAASVLGNFVLRALLQLASDRVTLRIFRRGEPKTYIRISESCPNDIGNLYCDIRFFPRRTGTFTQMPVKGQVAQKWVTDNAGVAVFDRNFRVQPYGTASDDWLQLQADAARNRREPRSQLALKHFPMSPEVKASTSENWMLRLAQSAQLVGLVQVSARRVRVSSSAGDKGLIASADREGFVENVAFRQMRDLVRGAVEALAYADRSIQQAQEEEDRKALISSLRRETRAAIQEIQSNDNITAGDKARIINALAETQRIAERHEESTRAREQQLEVMSLLGVVAGFMSHEFGVALKELEQTHRELLVLGKSHPRLAQAAESLGKHIKNLKEFVTYSSGYIQGAKSVPDKPYAAKPRLQQVKRIFGRYAEERGISVEINAENDLMVPRVPAALYNGLALNLYTNALKAVAAKADKSEGKIAFRSWNDDRWHYLEVSDTGIGIPSVLHERVFDPLFTTTDSNRDPLGSGMGLGLALVRRGAEAFGGRADVVDPPPGFATCVQIRLPLDSKGAR